MNGDDLIYPEISPRLMDLTTPTKIVRSWYHTNILPKLLGLAQTASFAIKATKLVQGVFNKQDKLQI